MTESNRSDNALDADGVENHPDYSCEIISVLVLLLLSALSRFWLLAMAAGTLLAAWGILVLLIRVWNFAALRVDSHRNTAPLSPSAPQVFLPDKIRPSADC